MAAITYLGQLVPALSAAAPAAIERIIAAYTASPTFRGRPVQLFVASANAAKIQAAAIAVAEVVEKRVPEAGMAVKGIDSASGVPNQPFGEEVTRRGSTTRLANLITAVNASEGSDVSKVTDSVLRIFIALENGLGEEKVAGLRNPDIFQTRAGHAFVDRCIVSGRVVFDGVSADFSAVSEGVTTPRVCVERSRATEWETTAGVFIEDEYGFPNKTWHDAMAGKERQEIMEEAILAALMGTPVKV